MQGARSRILYRRSDGQRLSIRDGNLLGSGGEGAIYALNELPDLVAKVYHNPSRSIGAKLTLMVDNPPTMPERDGHVSIAWPLDTLHTALPASSNNTVGFLMHRITSMKEVSQCYNPAARKRNFPHFTYRHLCAVAINIAIAVNAVHGRNYVIGDINESNILINDNALVTLIDTDSFQVIDQSDGTIYRSPVGKPEYTPPDLQGHSFDAVDRNEYHDRFGLGVIIFQLLMEGRHPYAGRFTGQGEPPAVEDNIASGHFLHSGNRPVPLVEGPGYMPWHTLEGSVAELFRLCFERGHDNQIVRPTAFLWEERITQAVDSFITCTRNPHHLYFGHNPTCPWCDRRNMLRGRDPFLDIRGPEPLLMRGTTGDSASPPGRHAPPSQQPQTSPSQQPPASRPQPSPRPQPRPPPPSPAQRTQPQLPTQGTSTFRGIPLPTDAKSAWAVLLLIVIGLSAVSLGVTRVVDFLESDPFGPDVPVSAPGGGGSTPILPVPPTSVPAPALAVAAPTPTETPTPTPTVEPSPTATVLPPSPTPVPLVAAPPPSTATPTPEPTPTREPVHVKPDLALDVGTFAWHPENPSLGDTVTFSISVRNSGGEAAPSRLGYRIYSVTDHVEPVFEGGLDVPGIPGNEQVIVSFDWIAQAGHHSLEIEADVADQLEESAETNNAGTHLLYDGTVLADLVVESISWSPEAPAMGDPVTFSVTIDNEDVGRAAPSTVQLFVDSDLIGDVHLQEILPGDSETVSFDWTAQVGTSTLRVVADSRHEVTETDEDNNELTRPYEATTYVDLIVEEINWEPLSPSVGDEVTLMVIVRNWGTLDAGESVAELSGFPIEGAFSTAEVQLTAIPAGESVFATFTWRAEPGEFTLTARADVHQTITESDENNNELDLPYGATALADFIVTGVSWKPERPAVGEEVTINVTSQNQGDGDGEESKVRLLIDGVEHGDSASLRRLSAGESDTVAFSWTAQMGVHVFSADVDSDDGVYESDETNNRSEMFEYGGARAADLIVKSADWKPESPSVGDTVTFRAVVENQGDAATRDFHVSFRDKSSVWQPMENVVSGELAAGRNTTVSFEWPADADPHEFVVVVDSRDEVVESDEDNNEHTFDYGATVVADLVVSGISSIPRSPSVDEDTTIRVTIWNNGRGRAGSFIVTLSIAQAGSHVDEVNKRVDEIAAGESRTLEFPWVAGVGPHTFTATADSRRVIPETNESNNVLEETIVTALPDLVVTNVEIDDQNPMAGDYVEIGVRIDNDGAGDSGRFVVSLHVNGSDDPYDSYRVGSLRQNETERLAFRWQSEEGCHKLRVVIDAESEVQEENEGNNRSQEFAICAVARS